MTEKKTTINDLMQRQICAGMNPATDLQVTTDTVKKFIVEMKSKGPIYDHTPHRDGGFTFKEPVTHPDMMIETKVRPIMSIMTKQTTYPMTINLNDGARDATLRIKADGRVDGDIETALLILPTLTGANYGDANGTVAMLPQMLLVERMFRAQDAAATAAAVKAKADKLKAPPSDAQAVSKATHASLPPRRFGD